METQDRRIKLIRDHVEKSKKLGQRRPHFSKDMKESVVTLLHSSIAAMDLAQITGLSISSLSRWGLKPATTFYKVSKEKTLKATSANDFNFRLTMPNGSVLESSSEAVFKKLFEMSRP